MKTRLGNGMLAGLAAAAASGAVALAASQGGLAPQFNPPDLLARLTGSAPSAVLGWAAHLLVYGLLLGLLFGALGRKLSDLGYMLSGLVAHLVFGLTLGFVYARLAGRDRDALVTPA